MTEEWCEVGSLTALPTAFQQRYDRLEAPQCTNLTYINTFRDKMLLFINDAEIRDILCHLSEAASNVNRIHVSTAIEQKDMSNFMHAFSTHAV